VCEEQQKLKATHSRNFYRNPGQMTKGLGFGGPVANNTGDDLIGLGIQQWFSPRWLPLNTTQKAFKASRNTIRSTSHPQHWFPII